ncbi:MAG: hypothetical protein PHU93_02690 [Candidatus Gracilibacteria bacterium]|nr:hypothetical protein [Candidatus Gracilibacteria bacterium]
MNSFPILVGTTFLTTAISLAHATDAQITGVKNTSESHIKIAEHVKAQTSNVLLDSHSRVSPEMNDEKMLSYLQRGVRSNLTPDAQLVIGNSRGLRLGVEFNLTPVKTNRNTFNDSRVGVGVLKNGVGVQWTAKF